MTSVAMEKLLGKTRLRCSPCSKASTLSCLLNLPNLVSTLFGQCSQFAFTSCGIEGLHVLKRLMVLSFRSYHSFTLADVIGKGEHEWVYQPLFRSHSSETRGPSTCQSKEHLGSGCSSCRKSPELETCQSDEAQSMFTLYHIYIIKMLHTHPWV